MHRVEAELQSSEPSSSPHFMSSPMEIDLKEEQLGRNIKIAIIDSGIDHQHSSFLCEERVEEFNDNIRAITLNDTIIAKASFCCKSTNSIESRSDNAATDHLGHGIQCAAVAAGRRIEGNLLGAFPIIAEGAALNAEIYSYKMAWRSDTMHKQDYVISSLDIEEAFQAAIQDKVDLISVSISEDCSYVNAVSIGSFNAMKNNILMVTIRMLFFMALKDPIETALTYEQSSEIDTEIKSTLSWIAA
ncbi:subtilisin-like protease sbt1.4 [Fagus crenata]